MHAVVETLKTRVNQLVRPEIFASAHLQTALDLRDLPEFDREWIRVHDALNALEASRPLTEALRQLIRDIERAAFMAVYSATAATDFTELAPAVSEDFGLFARGLCYDFRDAWLNGLFASYQRGVFPSGRIQPSEKGLYEMLREAV
jgi:hypothetical protein